MERKAEWKAERKAEVGGQERGRLERETRSGAWLIVVAHQLNVTDMSQEEFRDNIHLRYGIIPLNLPSGFNGCGEKFTV